MRSRRRRGSGGTPADPAQLHVPPKFWRNFAIDDEDDAVDGAVWLIAHMCEHLGLRDLGETELLDVGCGVRFTQAFLNRRLPIGRYVGVDAYRDLVEFLGANVTDPRFEFVHVDAHNEHYNPTGAPLSAQTPLPIDGRTFDLICLFSVFTHLAPHDYVAMLQLLRRFVKPDGRLFYTLFVDELTDGGYGLVDRYTRDLRRADADAERVEPARPRAAPYREFWADKPTLGSLYSREHALELVEGTGWEVLGLSPPDLHIQHHVVCAPV